MFFGAFTLTDAIMTQPAAVIKFIMRFPDDNLAVNVFLYKNNKSDGIFLFYFTVGKRNS